MTLEAIYYIGQTIAVSVIIATLVAILYQSSQANKIARLDMTARISEIMAANMRHVAADKELAKGFRKVMFEAGEIDTDTVTRVLLYFNSAMQANFSAYNAMREGLIAERALNSMNLNICWYLTRPLFIAEWRRTQPLYPSEFVEYINSCVEENAQLLVGLSATKKQSAEH